MPTVKQSLAANVTKATVKKAPVKVATKVVKKEVVVKEVKITAPKVSGMSVPVYSLLGKEMGTLLLPKEIFGATISKRLLVQAMRVYMTNKKIMSASTKSRGEINATTAKVWNQKGTGRARHGAKSAPIWVGGGRAFGPRPRVVRLELPQKMRKAALISALSSKMSDKKIVGISGFEKATGKTKEVSTLFKKMGIKNALILTPEKVEAILRATKNIKGIDVTPVAQLNAYEVLRHQSLVITKESLEALQK